MSIIHPKSKKELDGIIANSSNKLIVIDFFATWCGPCRMMGPKFKKMSEEFEGSILFIGIDVDEHEDLAATFDVNVMPTFVFFKNGEQILTIEGNNAEDVRKALEKFK